MDLAEAITAAVGVQPVPQLPRMVLPACAQHKEQMHADVQHAPPQQLQPAPREQPHSSTQASLASAECVPVRRPTLAEVRAASPPATPDGLQQPLDIHEAASTTALFDSMDSPMTQPQRDLEQHAAAAMAERALESDALVVASVSATGEATCLEAAKLSQQQQQQLLSQLWSELQSPCTAMPAEGGAAEESWQFPDAAVPVQGTDSAVAGSSEFHTHPVLPLQCADSTSPLSSHGSLQPSSSCCSSEQLGLAATALAAAAASTAARPSSPCSASSSNRALSTCSTSSSKKRVSWGDDVVFQLPPERPESLLSAWWHQLSGWGLAADADGSSSSWSTGAVAAGLVSAAAAAAVVACVTHRACSS